MSTITKELTKEQLIEDLKASTQNSSGMFEIGEDTICALMSMLTAQPAPVSVPECFKRLLHHAYGMTMGHDWNKGTMAGHHRAKLCHAVDECRAAMLQGSEPETDNTAQQFESLGRGDK